MKKRRATTKRGIPTFQQLVRDSLAAGMRRREAEGHARKILASYDLVEVDPRTGRWRFVTGGPLLVESTDPPSSKRPKGKTRTKKGAE